MKQRPAPRARRRSLVAMIIALVAGSIAAGESRMDRAQFDSVTTCGPAGVVTLWLERVDRGCGVTFPLVHAEGGPPAGLPEFGQIDDEALDPVEFAGDEILGHAIALHGSVAIRATGGARMVERTCRTSRASRDVLAVACEGADPEAACTGTLTLREGTP